MEEGELSDLPPEERAQVAALLAERGEEGEDWSPEPRIGPVRRTLRRLLRLMSLAALAAVAWHLFALWLLPDTPFDGVHAPIPLTIGFALFGILLLLWFDGRWRWLPLFALGIGALAVSGLSMRWIDSSRSGVHEYWAGIERGWAVLPGDLCYRIDGKTFRLRRQHGREGFTYRRGIWPGAYSEAEFRRYFFSDLPMRMGADGWACRAAPG